jgi:hypothetical protein
MFKVEYTYYNYPRKVREFKNYYQAKNFFYAIMNKTGVKRTELICPN